MKNTKQCSVTTELYVRMQLEIDESLVMEHKLLQHRQVYLTKYAKWTLIHSELKHVIYTLYGSKMS